MVRAVFRMIGVIWIVAVLVIGIGGTYLTHNPEAAGAYALGTMNVDRKAGVLTQAGQLAQGYSDAREGFAEMREDALDHARSAETSEARRKYREMREAGWGHEAAARAAGLPASTRDSGPVDDME